MAMPTVGYAYAFVDLGFAFVISANSFVDLGFVFVISAYAFVDLGFAFVISGYSFVILANAFVVGLTQKLSQTLITSCPLRLCGSFFPNFA